MYKLEWVLPSALERMQVKACNFLVDLCNVTITFDLFVHICSDYDSLLQCMCVCVITCRSDNSQYTLCISHADSTRVAVLSALAPSSGTCGVYPSGLAPHALLRVHDDHRGRGCHLPPCQPLCALQTGQSCLQRDNGDRGKTQIYTDTLVSLTHLAPVLNLNLLFL